MACATAVQQFFTDSFCFSEGLLILLRTSALDELLLDELFLDELLLDELCLDELPLLRSQDGPKRPQERKQGKQNKKNIANNEQGDKIHITF